MSGGWSRAVQQMRTLQSYVPRHECDAIRLQRFRLLAIGLLGLVKQCTCEHRPHQPMRLVRGSGVPT